MSFSSFLYFARRLKPQWLSFDRASLGILVTSCGAVFYDAYREGRAPLLASVPAGEYVASQRYDGPPQILTNTQCRQLEKQGYLIVDNFLSTSQVQQARKEIESLDADGRFLSSPNEQENLRVRNDRVYMHMTDNKNDALQSVQQQLALFAKSLTESTFSGFENDDYHARNLHVPNRMQVSIYTGNRKNEFGYFSSHLDSAGTDLFSSFGLLGWLKSRYMRQRYITCIVYLNNGWQSDHGGCLRLHTTRNVEEGAFDSTSFRDIPPVAGRLVVFSSLSQWHAVMPNYGSAQRYACSLWLTLQE